MYPIILPSNVVPRWQQALDNDRLIEWRSLAFWLSAEAKLAQLYLQYAVERDLLVLFELAMQHVYRLSTTHISEVA